MGTPVLTAGILTREGFRHGFTTRLGGVSEPPFESLDLALLRDPAKLRENLRRVGEAIGFDPAQLHQARQVHGRTLLVADGHPEAMAGAEADAIAAEPGTGRAVAVRVADCVPVLLADPESGRVVAVHAGWRGVEAGIVRDAVRHLAASPDARARLAVAIGPCIGPCCFEVGADVAERIAKASREDVVVRRVGEKAFVDLRAAVRAQLAGEGVPDARVEDVPGTGREGCTRCNPERFYSYRRDGDASGRLAGILVPR